MSCNNIVLHHDQLPRRCIIRKGRLIVTDIEPMSDKYGLKLFLHLFMFVVLYIL